MYIESRELMGILAKRVAQALQETGLKQYELAHRLATTQSTVSALMRGLREPRAEFVAATARVTGKPIEWFYGENGSGSSRPPTPTRSLPVLADRVALGPGVEIEEAFEHALPVNDREAESADCIIIVEGDSMSFYDPHIGHNVGYEDADEVGIRRVPDGYIPNKGEVIVVAINDHVTLKQFMGIENDEIILRPWNPLYTDMRAPVDDVRIVGVYAWHRHIATRKGVRRRTKLVGFK